MILKSASLSFSCFAKYCWALACRTYTSEVVRSTEYLQKLRKCHTTRYGTSQYLEYFKLAAASKVIVSLKLSKERMRVSIDWIFYYIPSELGNVSAKLHLTSVDTRLLPLWLHYPRVGRSYYSHIRSEEHIWFLIVMLLTYSTVILASYRVLSLDSEIILGWQRERAIGH